ncbi:PaaX family transcriptional regulator [Actinomadura rubrobrunea]|uniref:PaaX family transcriptional regulator n=1 Tax=Actinomadura rubrobrunea TaxID=115335 RepID=A0A9W6Q1J8_9ACTN|nr:PaaX family transcriptional regulator C-terminal domain-containing protein [Actinomadura rubrobrunea]GLW66846.1 PaaX family transcriptional regulator [Actinomadura rubrobrunea]
MRRRTSTPEREAAGGAEAAARTDADAALGPPRLRPQALMLTFLGNYVLRRDIAVFSGSFIEVFDRLGVGEQAVRSTLTRMVARDLLARHRRGRRMHFGLTERSARILVDGERRVWERGAVNTAWDGRWTVLAFSMPESWQRQRHDLRSRLIWAGFGPLGNGMWVTPSRVDVAPIIEDLGLDGRVKVFCGAAEAPTDVARMIRDAFDLDGLAAGYRAFLDRWDRRDPMPQAPDDLARYLWMLTEWLQLVRVDPWLPVEHLPADWPAVRAQAVLHELRSRYESAARRIADRTIEFIEAPPVATPESAPRRA